MAHRIQPFVLLGALTLYGCNGGSSTPAGPEQHETRSVELDKSERVRAELKMGSGELDVRGGASQLLDGDFTYNVAAWKPDIRYTAGNLTVEQHGSSSASGKSTNHWDLRLNDQVALDLKVEFGAGEAKLNLGSLNLRELDVEMGAGELRLDLRGAPTHDYSVRVQGGVGEATVYLPKDVGISASASGGLGGISVTGLNKNGDRYVNQAFQTAKVQIRLDIQGGVGSIKLIAE